MDVTKLPFNEFIGLKQSINSDYLLMLDDKREYTNHLDTVHASALFSLAEATSGHFILNHLYELTQVIPVVRKVETKYRKPAIGKIFSQANFLDSNKDEVIDSITQKGRILVKIEVSLFDEKEILVMQSVFEWFITKDISFN